MSLMVLGIGLLVWVGLCTLVLALCVTAKAGDRAGSGVPSHLPPRRPRPALAPLQLR